MATVVTMASSIMAITVSVSLTVGSHVVVEHILVVRLFHAEVVVRIRLMEWIELFVIIAVWIEVNVKFEEARTSVLVELPVPNQGLFFGLTFRSVSGSIGLIWIITITVTWNSDC